MRVFLQIFRERRTTRHNYREFVNPCKCNIMITYPFLHINRNFTTGFIVSDQENAPIEMFDVLPFDRRYCGLHESEIRWSTLASSIPGGIRYID